jgi:hypothetical protein
LLSNTIRYIGVPGNSQRATPGDDLYEATNNPAPWHDARFADVPPQFLAYDPDDPNDPYNDPNDPNRHRPGDTWEIGGKPYDPYDPGPWAPGRVRRPDPRTGRHRRGELPDPLPDGPQYDITTGLAYTVSEPDVVQSPPRAAHRRRLGGEPRAPQCRTAPDDPAHRRARTGTPSEYRSEPSPPRFPAPALPTDPDPYEFIGVYAPLGPPVFTVARAADTTTPPAFASIEPTAPQQPDEAAAPAIPSEAAPTNQPRLAEIAWQRFLANSAELHVANFETLSSLGEAHRARERLVWMLRWMLTVLALGLVGPPSRPEVADSTERVEGSARSVGYGATRAGSTTQVERSGVVRRPLPHPSHAPSPQESSHPSWMEGIARFDSAQVAAGGAW